MDLDKREVDGWVGGWEQKRSGTTQLQMTIGSDNKSAERVSMNCKICLVFLESVSMATTSSTMGEQWQTVNRSTFFTARPFSINQGDLKSVSTEITQIFFGSLQWWTTENLSQYISMGG